MKRFIKGVLVLGLVVAGPAFAVKAVCKNCTIHSDGSHVCETCTWEW